MNRKALFFILYSTLCLSGCQTSKENTALSVTPTISAVSLTPSVSPTPTITPVPTASPTPTVSPTPTISPTPTPIPLNTITATRADSPSQKKSVFQDPSLSMGYDNEDTWSLEQILFIGDSRTLDMMKVADNGNCIWIHQVGSGYQWMMEQAFPKADSLVTAGTAVVIAMGVNDPHNLSQYIQAINSQSAVWEERGAMVYYSAVGPVTSDPYVTNAQISDFNTSMYQNLNVRFLDSYNFLVENGFQTIDGLHYTESSSKAVFDFILSHIES